MVRLLMYLFGKDYEECKSCQTLKEQLDFERKEKAELTQTLLEILRPKAVEAAPIVLNPVAQSGALFARRRAALEADERERARILESSKNIGKSDDVKKIESLEEELGVAESQGA